MGTFRGPLVVSVYVSIKPYFRREPVRFDSFLFRNFRKVIVLVRFGLAINCPGSTRFGLRFSEESWLGPVRFRVLFRPVPKLSGSVRFGSVSYSFLLLLLAMAFRKTELCSLSELSRCSNATVSRTSGES